MVLSNPEGLLRLAGAVLVEQHDEWAASDRRYFSERSMALVTTTTTPTQGQVTTPELMSARSEHRPEREERQATTQRDVTQASKARVIGVVIRPIPLRGSREA